MLEFDETALYYAYSTIAQTLAGAMAVIAAFVLYRLSGLRNELGHNAGILAVELHSADARKLNGQGRYKELLRLAEQHAYAGRPTEFARLKELTPMYENLMGCFLFSLVLTAGVIVASVALIFWTHHIKSSWPPLVLLSFFTCTIVSYAVLLWKSLQ